MSRAARLARAEKALAQVQAAPRTVEPGKYAGDPVRYCEEVLGVELWAKQKEILRGLHEPPYRVLGRSSHSVGKTFTLACAVNYWYDTYNPGCVITTAPTARDVRDLLWAEVRLLRKRAGLGGFRGEQAPELYDGPDHYAKGFTAAKGESFQGRHPERLLLIFDEAIGVDALYWATARTMFDGSGKHGWLCMFNPTDTSSQAYTEEHKAGPGGEPAWKLVEVSSPEHPNIVAQLDGKPAPFPGAVTLAQFDDWLATWADPVEDEDADPETDLEWPPGSGVWYRPGPLMEGRALGRYPSQSTYGVWSERAWRLALTPSLRPVDLAMLPQVGCDPARHGDDYTALHTRWGHKSLRHERHNGWDTARTLERLKDLALWCADYINQRRPPQAKPVDPREIPIKVDADGLGVSLYDFRDGYNVIPVPASGKAQKGDEFFNKRTELWFTTFRRARAGNLDLSALPQEHRERIRQQCFAPQWFPDTAGLCRVEEKRITKQRLGFSPDDTDAMNLAYAEDEGLCLAEAVEEPEKKRPDPRKQRPRQSSHGLFGR